MPRKVKAAAKRGGRTGTKRARQTRGSGGNPFDRSEEEVKYAVAAEMIKKGDHSWEEIKEAAGGSLSPRTFGDIIIQLEKAGHRFERWQDPEYGTIYTPTAGAAKLGNYDGPDATGDTSAAKAAAARRVKAMKRGGTAAKRGKGKGVAKRQARPTRKTAAKRTPRKAAPAKKRAAKAPAKRAAKTTAAKKTVRRPRPRRRSRA